MNVLVVNAGSSTLKYQVIDTKSHKVSAKGSCERVCFTGGTFTHAANGSKKVTENIEFPDHKVAIEVVLKDLEANGVKIEGIGHRIVQGGWYFGDSSLVDEDVLAKIREVAPLAPLHNNPEANVIEYCLEQYPDLPNVTVYDTAFHFNMPEVAKTYALPKDVCDKLCDKLIFRHPHVFGEVKAETAGQVSENWEQLKLKEKDGNKSVLSGVPAALPSLIKAYRIQDKARNVGFDWEEREQVWDKVKEEIGEFQEEVANMDKDKAEAEFGDVMFSLINAARLYKINPDNALERTNQKFIRRFNYLEEHTIKEGKNLKDMSLEEMDAIWNKAKKKGL